MIYNVYAGIICSASNPAPATPQPYVGYLIMPGCNSGFITPEMYNCYYKNGALIQPHESIIIADIANNPDPENPSEWTAYHWNGTQWCIGTYPASTYAVLQQICPNPDFYIYPSIPLL